MKIDKTIEILELQIRLTSPNLEPDLIKANELGIEALKREKFNRENPDYVIVGPLPGETKE